MTRGSESREPGMDMSATAVRFDDSSMWLDLSDGRTLGVPYAWFPRLLNATIQQREAVEIGRFGLHWDDIDEDISIAGLLAGRRDQTLKHPYGALEASKARVTGYVGESCPECGNFTMVRNGTCLKCDTCGGRRVQLRTTPCRGLAHRHGRAWPRPPPSEAGGGG